MFVFQENLSSAMASEEVKPIQEILSLLILLADRVINAAQAAESYKNGNLEIARLVTELSQLLRPLARLTATSTTVYDRPIRRVCLDVAKALDRALTFARRCRHERTNFLHQLLSINTAADMKKASTLLNSSLADLQWLLSIYNRDCYDHGTMPPFACTDPILAYVWPAIAALHMGRAEGAEQLADFANNERTKNVIVEEIGIPPLLKMLKESRNVDAQSAAATALCNLGDDQDRVTVIRDEHGVQAVVTAMARGPPMRVQLRLVEMVLKMLEVDAGVQEEFGVENVTRLLVALLGADVDLDEFVESNYPKTSSSSHLSGDIRISSEEMKINGSGECSRSEKEREAPEVKLRLKTSCAVALWKLARKSLLNSQNITDTKALLVLAKIIKKEQGDLKKNCLKVVMELAAVAESHAELKRTAFKLTSTPAKVVLDQLLKVMNEEKNPELVTPAVKAVGCLASMFPAKEKRVVRGLVAQLSNWNHDVAVEAARALSKFVCVENYNCKEHCEAIIESDGVAKLMTLLRKNVRGYYSHLEEVVLLCHLAINGDNTRALEEARVLSALEGAAKHAASERPDLRELFAKALHQLVIYQVGIHPQLHSSEA